MTTEIRTVTISISSEPTFLGEEASAEDLDRFESNLAKLIASEFGVSVRTQRSSQIDSAHCREDSGVDARLHEINSSDEWIYLLG
jgi:hypothetical protein